MSDPMNRPDATSPPPESLPRKSAVAAVVAARTRRVARARLVLLQPAPRRNGRATTPRCRRCQPPTCTFQRIPGIGHDPAGTQGRQHRARACLPHQSRSGAARAYPAGISGASLPHHEEGPCWRVTSMPMACDQSRSQRSGSRELDRAAMDAVRNGSSSRRSRMARRSHRPSTSRSNSSSTAVAGRSPARRPKPACRASARTRERRRDVGDVGDRDFAVGELPATANAIATRWSPWLSTRRMQRAAVDRGAVGASSTSMPSARRPAAIVAMRSDSLTRNSAAPRIVVAPSRAGRGDEQRRELVDHVRRRARPARRCRAAARGARRRSATGSPPCSPAFASTMSAPIARSTCSRPVRRGFMPTASQAQLRARHQRRRDDEERRRREIRRHRDVGRAQAMPAAQRALRPARSRSASRTRASMRSV